MESCRSLEMIFMLLKLFLGRFMHLISFPLLPYVVSREPKWLKCWTFSVLIYCWLSWKIDGSCGDCFDITMTFVSLMFNLRPNFSLIVWTTFTSICKPASKDARSSVLKMQEVVCRQHNGCYLCIYHLLGFLPQPHLVPLEWIHCIDWKGHDL